MFYVPREDTDMTALHRSTHCPYKGDASYFDLSSGPNGQSGGWSYETPH
ncbi:DUF427 domain-containing protein [Xaviernesmea rhizosphaerae]